MCTPFAIGVLIMACLRNQVAVASRTMHIEMRATDADASQQETSNACRCHEPTYRCANKTGLFSKFSVSWKSVPAGFCDADLLHKREEFEVAMQYTDKPSEWSNALETQMEILRSKVALFEEAVEEHIGMSVNGTTLTDDKPTLEEFLKMNMGQTVFVFFGVRLSQAKAILQTGRSLSADKQQEIMLTTQLEEAIKGLSAKALDDAMRAANQATVVVPWSMIVRAEARQRELVALKAKLFQVGATTKQGKNDLQDAMEKLTAVENKMEEIQLIQDDLGDQVRDIFEQHGGLMANNAILARLTTAEKELHLQDSSTKLDSLGSSASATISKIGTSN